MLAYVRALITVAAFATASSMMILVNKQLLTAWPYPCALTAIGQLACGAVGLALHRPGITTIPSGRSCLRHLLPIAVASAVSLQAGNAAYLYLSVSFIQLLKSMTPGVTLLISAMAGVEMLSPSTITSVVLIGAGSSLAALIERSEGAFHAYGFGLFVLSSVFDSVRVVLVHMLQGSNRLNTAETMVFVGIPTGLVLGGTAIVTELPGLKLLPTSVSPGTLMLAVALSVAVTVLTFLVIRETSPLTLKVVACAKNLLVVGLASTLYGDHVAPLQLLGYTVSSAGFVTFTWFRQTPASPKKTV